MNGWSVLRGLFMDWTCTGHGGACFAKHSRIKITRVKRRVTAVHRLLSTLLLPTKGRPEQLIGIVSPLLRCHKRCSPKWMKGSKYIRKYAVLFSNKATEILISFETILFIEKCRFPRSISMTLDDVNISTNPNTSSSRTSSSSKMW